jgi:hypothetical protein
LYGKVPEAAYERRHNRRPLVMYTAKSIARFARGKVDLFFSIFALSPDQIIKLRVMSIPIL